MYIVQVHVHVYVYACTYAAWVRMHADVYGSYTLLSPWRARACAFSHPRSLSDFPSRLSLSRALVHFAHARDESARALLFCIPLFLSLCVSFSLSVFHIK